MPFLIGIITFVIAGMIFGSLAGDPVCADGWVSPSIGNAGACSWHGGVREWPQRLAMLASLVAAITAGYKFHVMREKYRQKRAAKKNQKT